MIDWECTIRNVAAWGFLTSWIWIPFLIYIKEVWRGFFESFYDLIYDVSRNRSDDGFWYQRGENIAGLLVVAVLVGIIYSSIELAVLIFNLIRGEC